MNQLTPELIKQLVSQESEDPFLTLITMSHASFADDVRLVNNKENIISRGDTYIAFPVKIRLPVDDGESVREVSIEFDNVSLYLIDEFRTVTTQINVKLEMILASMPDIVQISLEDLKIQTINYDKYKISAKLILDNFLNTEMTSERYEPTNYPGLF